jgi:DNA-binding winged helix-turn-helix (wHTH) protein/Tol biopolymer transport system component
MLKSHRNLLEPRPSDRVRIGERIVDIPLREIASADGGEPMRVTLKSLGVLLVLVAHAGRPVSREALLEWVWPDTLPSDDVVTQAITQLRKALGDDREHPRYIETLAKQGYRLIAPVAWVVDDAFGDPVDNPRASPEVAETPSTEAAASPREMARSARVAMVAAVLLALVAGGAWVWRDRTRTPASAPVARPLQATPPVLRIASAPQSESSPSLSPDGSLVVYARYDDDARNATLAVQSVSAVPPTALTEPVREQWDENPSWSPDGREIAFLRSTRAQCRVMLVPATGGVPRELGACLVGATSIAWFPDGRALIASGSPGDGEAAAAAIPARAGSALHRMEIATGQWRPIAYERLDDDIDVNPRVSPDGRWIVFQRNLSLGDLWRIPVGGGRPQRLTRRRTNFFGQAWLPDSRGLIYAALEGGRIGLRRLDFDAGTVAEYHLDGATLGWPSIAAGNGGQVAFGIETVRTQLRENAFDDGAQAHARSRPVFPSSRSDTLPSLAPDGRQLLFVSDRDGQDRLWWGDRTRPDSLRAIPDLVPMPRLPTDWRADSSQALTVGELPDGGKRVYEIEPERGRVRMLDVPDAVPVHAAYHPDPDRILIVAEREQGRLGMTLYDRSRRPWRALARVEDVILAVADPVERRIVFVRTLKPGLWQVDLDLRNPRQIDAVAYRQRIRSLMPGRDGLWVADADETCEWRLRRVKGAHAPESYCLGAGPYSPVGFGFDGAGRRWLATATSDSSMDLGVLPLSAFAPVDAAAR